MAGQQPGRFTGRDYSAEDIALMWCVPTATVRAWLRDGLVHRDRDERVDRAMLLRFVNSSDGRAALAAARATTQ